MNTARSAFRPLLVLAFAAVACRGPLPVSYFEETPLGSGIWKVIPAEPTWGKTTPRKADHITFVVDSASNLRGIVRPTLDDWAARQIAHRVDAVLRTVVPEPEAAAAASAASSSLRLLQCACRNERHVRPADPTVTVIGGQTETVWGLYEIPMEKVLEPVAESHRAAARSELQKL